MLIWKDFGTSKVYFSQAYFTNRIFPKQYFPKLYFSKLFSTNIGWVLDIFLLGNSCWSGFQILEGLWFFQSLFFPNVFHKPYFSQAVFFPNCIFPNFISPNIGWVLDIFLLGNSCCWNLASFVKVAATSRTTLKIGT